MTKIKFPGISVINSRKKLGLRLRTEIGNERVFDKFLTLKDLSWDNPKDHEKVQAIVYEAIVHTNWIPHDKNSMKRLFKNLSENHGILKDFHKKYKHIKSSKLYNIPDKEDLILTELRLIRNYLEKLTLLQEVKEEVER